MAINPLALAVQNPDIVGRAFQGFEQGQQVKARNALAQYGMAASNGDKGAMSALFQGNPEAAFSVQADNRVQARAEDAKRLKGLEGLAMMGREIMRLPPEARGPAVEQAKLTAARMFGMNPADLDYVTPDTIGAVTATVESEYDRLAQALGLQSAQMGLRGQELDLRGKESALRGAEAQNAYYNSLLGGGGGASAPAGNYFSTLTGVESGGNPAARNPNSSATGLGQFIDSTWSGLVRSPEGQAAGLTPDGRTDPNQSMRALEIFTQKNAQELQAAGIPVTEKTAYLAHFLGAAGAVKALTTDPNQPAADVFPEAARANPTIFYANGQPRTLGEVVQLQTSRFSDAPISVGAGSGVGVGPAAAPTPAPGGIVTQGNSFTGGGVNIAPPAPAMAPPAPGGVPPAPAAPAGLPAATGPQQSIVEIAQSDPLIQQYMRDGLRAQQFGNTMGVQQARAMIDARMKELEATAPKTPGAPNFGDENALRTQYRQVAEPRYEILGSYEIMNGLAGDATGASDVALVFRFFKTIDPTSTVRESEYAAAASAQGLEGRFVTAFEGLQSGQKLSPELRRELVAVAKRNADKAKAQIDQFNKQYADWARAYGMDPNRIIIFPNAGGPTGAVGADPFAAADAIVGLGR